MQMEPLSKMYKFVISNYSIVLLLFLWQECGHSVRTNKLNNSECDSEMLVEMVPVNLDDDGTVIQRYANRNLCST